VCDVQFQRVDLTDAAARRAVIAPAAQGTRCGLGICEGPPVYLTPAKVSELARDLHAARAFRYWLIDLGSPRLLKMLERTWGRTLRAGNAPMRFAPAQGTAFFAPLGWRELEFRSTLEESVRLGRTMRFARFFRLLSWLSPRRKQQEIRRMSGIVLLERVAQ
jgi:hypothetical protein